MHSMDCEIQIESALSAKSALWEAEDSELFEEIPLPAWVHECESLQFLKVNRAAIQKYGYSREEFLAMTLDAIRRPQDVPRLRQHFLDLASTETALAASEWLHRSKDGRVFEVEITVQPILFRGRRARLVVTNDITSRKAAERRLSTRYALTRLLSESSSEATEKALHCLCDAMECAGAEMWVQSEDGECLERRAYWKEERVHQTVADLPPARLPALPQQSRLAQVWLSGTPCWIDDLGTALPYLNRAGVLKRSGIRGGLAFAVRGYGSVSGVVVLLGRARIGDDREFLDFIVNIGCQMGAHIERCRAERRLRETREAFHALFDDAPVAYHETDRNGIILRVNRAECELLGRDASEMVGKPVWDFVSPDQVEQTRASQSRICQEGKVPPPFERTVRDRMGAEHILQLHQKPITGPAGEVLGVRTAMLDITESKSATRHIELQAKLLADVNEAIIAGDARSRITYWNAAAERLFGYSAGAVLGKKYAEVIRPTLSREESSDLCAWVWRTSRSHCEIECQNAQGNSLLLQVSFSVIRDEEGQPETIVGIHRDMTQQTNTEERLRMLSAAVEQSPVSIVITDLHGAIEYANPKAIEVTGYSWEELKGKNPRLFKSGETPAKVYRDLWATIRSGAEWRGTFHNRRKNGELFWEAETILPIREASGAPKHYLAVKEDITPRREMEAALRESEQRFRIAAECTSDLICDWDFQSGKVELFGSGEQLCGPHGGAPSILYEDFMAMVHPDDRDHLRGAVQRHLESGECYQEEYRLLSPAGEVIDWLDRGRAIRDPQGTPYRWVGASANITERKKILNALAQSEERFRLITESISEVFWMTDADLTQMLYVSPAYERIWGCSRESLYAAPHSFLDLVHPDDFQKTLDYIQSQRSKGERMDHEYRIVDSTGAIKWIWNRGFPLMDADGRLSRYVGVALDITERKELERQLTQAQKLESIGQLAAGIAHEINTPIQYIGDNGRFLEEAFADLVATLEAAPSGNGANGAADFDYLRQEIPNATRQILEGVDNVSRIVRATHPGTAERAPIDINRAIESAIAVSRNEWKYVADLSTDFDRNLPLVPCLAGEFNQVMLNLIVNAAQAIADVVKGWRQKRLDSHPNLCRRGVRGDSRKRYRRRHSGGDPVEDFQSFFHHETSGQGNRPRPGNRPLGNRAEAWRQYLF